MSVSRVLVANRGEVAIRVMRAVAELGLESVAVYSRDDTRGLHTRRADRAVALDAAGPAAYLDIEALVALALENDCDAVHPGYGFLSESAAFARRCGEEGLTFIGPPPDLLELFGDKARARALAERCQLPLLPGSSEAVDRAEAAAFFASLSPGSALMLKAVVGGGGRGMRVVRRAEDLEEAWDRCRSEAERAFGRGELYVEQCLDHARHIEVQIVGDASGGLSHLYERECSLQRRHQKLIEIAPSPALDAALRERVTQAALRMAEAAHFEGVGTFEFLLASDVSDVSEERRRGLRGAGGAPNGKEPFFAFMEVNPRLQVEHTVTEAVLGIDLVKAQLQIAAGHSLAELGLEQEQIGSPRGFALELRINAERIDARGHVLPSGGRVTLFEPPTGLGLRVDSAAYAGYEIAPAFDSLLAKLIAHEPSGRFEATRVRAARALRELRIEGVETNAALLLAILHHPQLVADHLDTRFVETHIEVLLEKAKAMGAEPLFFEPDTVAMDERGNGAARPAAGAGLAGAKLDSDDPLAVLDHGKRGVEDPPAKALPALDEASGELVRAPLQGTVLSIAVVEGERVGAGAALLVMEAMKMEHVVEAPFAARVLRVDVAEGDAVFADHPLLRLEPEAEADVKAEAAEAVDLERVRPDLESSWARHRLGLDEARPKAVARRRATGQRTARENVADLCDEGSFVEYGPLVIAAQRRRRELQDLIERTPADGLVGGVGRVNGDLFDASRARCVVLSYDYTVLAGTQGAQNHRKKDRLFEIAERWRLPLVLFAEGGGGRPGDTDALGVAGLDCLAFHYFARLSGLVPLVGVVSGRCFAGNAALLGCCDIVIATANSNIGMGGPAMIEGGGLGIFRPEEVGPMSVQVPNGVVDVAVGDEAEAVAVARRYLAYFQGPIDAGECEDQRLLRALVPENRLRVYDVHAVVETLADADSVLELRPRFGLGMLTALVRVEGRPIGIVANNPVYLAGAIDSDGADKAARFMKLCDAFDIPILFLCDTPGIMVGPEAEASGTVRHASRMFLVGANLQVPFFTIVLRKSYGLGAQAMAGGSFRAPFFTVSWPTGEFGGMGLEGAVKLGFRKELAAIEDAEERRALYEQMVARMYEHGEAQNAASYFEIDDVIDPAESRRWILAALDAAGSPEARRGKRHPCVDSW